jgi:hypothetical protein
VANGVRTLPRIEERRPLAADNGSAQALFLLLFLFNRTISLFSNIQRSYQECLNALPAFAGVVVMLARCEAGVEAHPENSEAVELREGIQFEGSLSLTEAKGLSPRSESWI